MEWRLLGCTKRAKGLAIENWLPIFEKELMRKLAIRGYFKRRTVFKERGFEFVTFPKVDYKKNLMIGLQLLLLVMVSFLYQLLCSFCRCLWTKSWDCYARATRPMDSRN